MKQSRLLPVLFLGAFVAACEGPMGPAGSPGPGTRLVLEGVMDNFGEIVLELPADAGTLDSPPAVACYISGDDQTWIVVALDTDGGVLTAGCLLVPGEEGGNVAVVVLGVPAWTARVVVIY